MLDTFPHGSTGRSLQDWLGHNVRATRIWYAFMLLISLAFAYQMYKLPPKSPIISFVAWAFYFVCVAALFYEPRYGIYFIVFFGLLGDQLLMPWFPFLKNFSSAESWMFFNASVKISPFESVIVLTLLAWLIRGGMRRRLDFRGGDLFWFARAFGGGMVLGLVWGLAQHGNFTIAMWEVRPILYLPLMLILTSNLIRERGQVNIVFWMAMSALILLGLYGVYDFVFLKNFEISRIESNIEHAAAIRLDTVYVAAIAVWLYKGSWVKRVILPAMIPFVFVTYIVAQRRASMMALALALVLILVVIFKQKRALFWKIAPPMMVISVLYLGAFWNNQSAAGLPARAIKSVVMPSSGNGQEDSSNEYRVIENLNTDYTIHHISPLTGLGFGKPFYIVVQLPDISFFEWWQYITHNSIMWIWMQTGATGFLSMLMLIGMSIVVGVRALLRMPEGDMSAFAMVAVLYIMMHFMYAYVDMSWDNASMLYVGMMMGLCNSFEDIVAKPIPTARKRWHWQPEPVPAGTLRPIEEI